MNIAVLLWVSTLVLSIIGFNKKLPTGLLVFILLLFIIGFRVGTIDYDSYNAIYSTISLDWSKNGFSWFVDIGNDKIEWGYALLITISKELYDSFYFFIFFYYFFTLIFKFYLFHKISNFFYLTIFAYISLGYYTMDMATMRMGLATTLVIVSYLFIQEKKLFKFIFTILLASSIHIISIIAMPLYFVVYFRSTLFWLIMFGMSIIISILGGGGKLVALLVSTILGDNFISNSLTRYATSTKYEGFSLFGGTYILLSLTAILMLIFRKRLGEVNKYNANLIVMLLFGIVFSITFYDFGIVSFRIKDLIVIPILCLVLPSFILIFEQKFFIFFMLLIYCILFFIAFGGMDMPYTNLLFN